jgi:hypothetical protein
MSSGLAMVDEIREKIDVRAFCYSRGWDEDFDAIDRWYSEGNLFVDS